MNFDLDDATRITDFYLTLDEYPEALDALRGDRTVHKIIIECWQG